MVFIFAISSTGMVFASHPNGSGYPYIWFVSWNGNSQESTTVGWNFGFGGFMWADTSASTISVHVSWGDGSSTDLSSNGSLNPSYTNPTWTAFVNPLHTYTVNGTFTLRVTLSDVNGNSAGPAATGIYFPLTINVINGYNQQAQTYATGGRAPTKL